MYFTLFTVVYFSCHNTFSHVIIFTYFVMGGEIMAATAKPKENVVATFVLDTAAPYNILDFDQGLCVMTGYSPRELAGKINTLDKLLYVDDFTETITSINYQLSISNLITFQKRVVTKTGDILTVLCNGQAYSLNDGRDVLQCVFTDITHLETAANETAQAKTDLEIFANTVPSGLSKHLLDNNLSLIWANNYFYSICGYTKDSYKETFGRSMLTLIFSEDLATVIDALADLKEEGKSQIVNFRIKSAGDNIKWVNAVFANAGETSEGFPVVNIVLSDITNLKEAEMKAALEEQKYLIISDISEELPYEYDIATDTIKFADKFENIFEGHAVMENPSVNMIKTGLASADSKSAIEELFYLAKTGTEYHASEFKLNTKNGGYQWYFSSFSSIYNEKEEPVRAIGLLRNIHAQKVEQQRLIEKSETDQMTGLLNKVTTENKIKSSLRELDGNSYNVFMLIDIDDFKNINDTYGHLTGDEVIISIAESIKKYAGDYGCGGRLGGDEFCLFLTNVLDMTLALEKATYICESIRNRYPGNIDAPKVTLSIGIAATNEQLPMKVLMENADTALYQVKQRGKNGFFLYEDDMERAEYKNSRDSSTGNSTINEIMSTLFTGSNTYSCIERALKLVGASYPIDKISIFEYGFNRNFVNCTHQWCAEGVKNDITKKQHTPATVFEEIDSMGNDGIAYSSDTSILKLNNSSMNPSLEGIKKLVQSEIMLTGKVIGYICFYSMDINVNWTADTLSSFKLLFKLFAEAICTKQNQKALDFLRDDTAQAFDIVQNPMIIIDRDTYEVVYSNDISKDYYPEISVGSKCYMCISQKNSPCEDCPMHKASDRIVTISRYNKIFDESLDASFIPINWSIGKNTYLMSMAAHKQTKAEKLKLELEQNINIEKKIAEASYKDMVTGYGNFEKFKLDAQKILDENKNENYVLAYLNIKSFKYINEAYGYSVGDTTLKTVADIFKKYIGENEAFARVINDTFILLMRYPDNASFMRSFENIKNEVHDACKLIQDKFSVDFITGILIIDDSVRSYDIMHLVDRSIMTEKSIDEKSGISYAYYDDEYHKRILNAAQIENSMYDALENGEFCAYAQPKYDISTKKLIGSELLVRWLSPTRGFLEPGSFIPTFEKNGFIYNIDFFMLEEACKSIRKYLDEDVEALPFSVNLSRATVSHADLLTRIQNTVDKYFIPHHYIEFEITESIFAEHYDEMITVLKQLKDMDFLINMDDFGSGYSSLTLLKDLPVDIIKLDHDFLSRSAANDERAVKILQGIIDMAHAMDIKIVSEGIETDEQLDMLRSINCEIGQGFLFAKPMPIDDYDKLILNNGVVDGDSSD